ncbi:unnamed protein product [Brassica oleracea]
MTQVLVRRATQGRKLRRWDVKTICFFFFVMFQISYSLSASVASCRHQFVSSPPRKTLVYATSPFRGPFKEDNIYGDDKRVVRTGPNPLHK